jgi:hypothetical protein
LPGEGESEASFIAGEKCDHRDEKSKDTAVIFLPIGVRMHPVPKFGRIRISGKEIRDE